MSQDKGAFEAGYLIAVANIVHLHDEPVIAVDVLRESGIRPNAVRRLKIDDYDASVLRRLFRQIRRQELMK